MNSLLRRSLHAVLVLGILAAATAIVNPRFAAVSPVKAAPVPMIAVTPNVVAVDSTALVHGTGFTANSQALVFWQRPDRTTHAVLIFTDGSGMFSLRLGFSIRHGTGAEFVAARDVATNVRTMTATVTVNPRRVVVMGTLFATRNPVMLAGTTQIIGTGFVPGTRVFVTWSRPDGTHTFIEVVTNMSGAFSFSLFANPRHGCGVRTFFAIDLATGTQSLPLSLVEVC
jgi:hypothetical protein